MNPPSPLGSCHLLGVPLGLILLHSVDQSHPSTPGHVTMMQSSGTGLENQLHWCLGDTEIISLLQVTNNLVTLLLHVLQTQDVGDCIGVAPHMATIGQESNLVCHQPPSIALQTHGLPHTPDVFQWSGVTEDVSGAAAVKQQPLPHVLISFIEAVFHLMKS